MKANVKALIKRHAPAPVHALRNRLQKAIAGRPIDDVVLARYSFTPDTDARPRINLVIPEISPRRTFGGVSTGLDVFLRLARAIADDRDIDLRVIVTDATGETDVSTVIAQAKALGLDARRITSQLIRQSDAEVAVRADDVFVVYNFWTALNTEPLLDAQAAYFGRERLPLIYLIQEYEPHLYAFSSAQMMTREAYDMPRRLWGVFNSSNLHRYYETQGHGTEKAFVFEPVINEKLRHHLPQVASAARERRILVYGRPNVERNCFPALRRGLRAWAQRHPELQDWEVVSAGAPHDPVDLGDGRQMRSVGKLSLDDYAQMLLSTSVGVSLMASPHPSYPPLEMAHMGIRTITNSYLCKDLSGFHPNILSLASIREDALASALARACQAAMQAPPDSTVNAGYVRKELYPFMDELAASVIALL